MRRAPGRAHSKGTWDAFSMHSSRMSLAWVWEQNADFWIGSLSADRPSSYSGRRSPAPGQSPTVGFSRHHSPASSHPTRSASGRFLPTLRTLAGDHTACLLPGSHPRGKVSKFHRASPLESHRRVGWGGGKCARKPERGAEPDCLLQPALRHEPRPRPGSGDW